jgi:hypothetical protein
MDGRAVNILDARLKTIRKLPHDRFRQLPDHVFTPNRALETVNDDTIVCCPRPNPMPFVSHDTVCSNMLRIKNGLDTS